MNQHKQFQSAKTSAGLKQKTGGENLRPSHRDPASAPYYTVPSLPTPGRTTWSLLP